MYEYDVIHQSRVGMVIYVQVNLNDTKGKNCIYTNKKKIKRFGSRDFFSMLTGDSPMVGWLTYLTSQCA